MSPNRWNKGTSTLNFEPQHGTLPLFLVWYDFLASWQANCGPGKRFLVVVTFLPPRKKGCDLRVFFLDAFATVFVTLFFRSLFTLFHYFLHRFHNSAIFSSCMTVFFKQLRVAESYQNNAHWSDGPFPFYKATRSIYWKEDRATRTARDKMYILHQRAATCEICGHSDPAPTYCKIRLFCPRMGGLVFCRPHHTAVRCSLKSAVRGAVKEQPFVFFPQFTVVQ